MMPHGSVLMNKLRSQRRMGFKESSTESSAMREQVLPDEVAAQEQATPRNAALWRVSTTTPLKVVDFRVWQEMQEAAQRQCTCR